MNSLKHIPWKLSNRQPPALFQLPTSHLGTSSHPAIQGQRCPYELGVCHHSGFHRSLITSLKLAGDEVFWKTSVIQLCNSFITRRLDHGLCIGLVHAALKGIPTGRELFCPLYIRALRGMKTCVYRPRRFILVMRWESSTICFAPLEQRSPWLTDQQVGNVLHQPRLLLVTGRLL
jgi:hypothetical protein